jgi:hypothetical protein
VAHWLTRGGNRRSEDLDAGYARRLNQEQYEAEGDAFGCLCCYGDYAFEEIGACRAGHTFCRRCMTSYVQVCVAVCRHALSEVYTHAWPLVQQNVMGAYVPASVEPPPPIQCFAGADDCKEGFSDWTLQYSLPTEVYDWYMQAVAKAALTKVCVYRLRGVRLRPSVPGLG